MYPIMLNLENKRVIVVGGGKVAERKVEGLLPSGANITVISPDVTETLTHLAVSKQIQWLKKPFASEDISGAFLVFAATNDRELNRQIQQSAKENQLVNIADDPDQSNFHVPARIERGHLSITVSTNGASPVLAKKIKEQLEAKFDQNYIGFLDFLFEKRKWILKEVKHPELKKQLLTAIADLGFLEADDRNAKFTALYEEKRKRLI